MPDSRNWESLECHVTLQAPRADGDASLVVTFQGNGFSADELYAMERAAGTGIVRFLLAAAPGVFRVRGAFLVRDHEAPAPGTPPA